MVPRIGPLVLVIRASLPVTRERRQSDPRLDRDHEQRRAHASPHHAARHDP